MRPGVVALSHSDRTTIPGSSSGWDPRANPYLGEPEARFAVVEMLDYSCPHCREVYQHLKQAQQRYPSQFAVVVLPVPLNVDCNEYVQVTKPDHVDACHYARLAIAVWLADAKQFPLYHEWLFESPRPPAVEDAKAHAAALVGSAALDKALRDPQLEQVLARNRRLYHLLGADVLPKLVIGNYISSGRIQYPDAVLGMLEDYLGIKPTGK
jgi:protein-disulfide isomerase